MLRAMIDALNAVQPQVWQAVQFMALLAVVMVGAALYLHGQAEAAGGLITGAFALLRFEVGRGGGAAQ